MAIVWHPLGYSECQDNDRSHDIKWYVGFDRSSRPYRLTYSLRRGDDLIGQADVAEAGSKTDALLSLLKAHAPDALTLTGPQGNRDDTAALCGVLSYLWEHEARAGGIEKIDTVPEGWTQMTDEKVSRAIKLLAEFNDPGASLTLSDGRIAIFHGDGQPGELLIPEQESTP